ncbi:MAG: hypothetical protein LBV72_13215 [Tannerella sp.]|jgi:hypothetical protein|nr:hypothetical protein [Tannerella sp.]
MKRIIFSVLCSFVFIAIHAQTETKDCKYSFATTLGTGISMSSPSYTPFTWQVLGYYNLTDRWSVGAGTGLSFYEEMLIPVFGDARFQIGRTRKFTPFAEFGIGYSLAPSSDVNGGFFMNPSFGVEYALKNKMKIQFAVGYEFQEFDRLKSYTDNYFESEFEEHLSHHSISFKLGLRF